jgi:hypothetical protein
MRPAVRAAVARLRIDSASADVLRAFDDAGVESVLLKGASNREWLGDAGQSGGYADCDLLIHPDHGDEAARVLVSLGFVAELEAERMPTWWREHAIAWIREQDRATMDVHRTLPGVAVDDRRAWALLTAGAQEIVVGGYAARALAIPARAMHIAIHAAHHGRDSAGRRDLNRALERCDDDTWRAAAELARKLGALDALLTGLRMVPAGLEVAGRIGVETHPCFENAVVGTSSRGPALTIERFVRAGSIHTRLSMIRHKLIPPKTFIRRWSRLARRGRLGLMVAYAWRPLWVLAHLPRAALTWRRGRSSTPEARAGSAR